MNLVIGLLVPFLGTSLGAACVFFMKNGLNRLVQKALLGFASGVMVAASVWSLLIPSIDMSEGMGKFAFLPAAIGFIFGILFLLLMDKIIPHLHMNEDKPEGLPSHLKKTTMLVLAVTLHNIPEGMSIAVPLVAGGMKKGKVALLTALSGAPTLLGGLLGAVLGNMGNFMVASSLGIAAGAMLYVTYCEILPEVILLNKGRRPALFTIGGIIFGLVITRIMV